MQPLPKTTLREQLRGLGKNQEMLLGGLLRDEKDQNVHDWPSIGRVEINRGRKADVRRHDVVKICDPGMRNGYALTQPRRSDALAMRQVRSHDATRQFVGLLDVLPDQLEQVALTGRSDVEKDVFRR